MNNNAEKTPAEHVEGKPPPGERLGIYLMCLFLGGWFLIMFGMQGYLIAKHGVGSGLDGGGHVPADIAEKYGTSDVKELMKLTNKAIADRPRGETSTFADDLPVYIRAVAILGALTAFWYFVVSRITPFPGTRGPVDNSGADVDDYPRLRRFTLTCDVILFVWIVAEGAFIIPFMLYRYGLHY